MRDSSSWAAFAIGVVTVTGCGAGGPSSEQSEVIDDKGGSIQMADGTELIVPAGALRGETEITIRPSARTTPDAVGPAYSFLPSGLHFDAPVTIRLAYAKEHPRAITNVQVVTAPEESGAFEAIGGAPATFSRVEAQTTHFSIYAPAAGAAEVLATGENFPNDLAVVDGSAYWTSDGDLANVTASGDGLVMRLALAGGDPTPVAGPQSNPRHLAVQGDALCWSNGGVDLETGGGVTGSAVLCTSLAGGDPVVVAGDLGFANDVLMHEGDVYFADIDRGTIDRVPLAGGAVTIVSSGNSYPAYIAQSNGQLFFTATDGGQVVQVAMDGSGSVTLATDQGEPRNIVADGGYVYWVNAGDGRVMRAPVGGGELLVLAEGQAKPNGLVVADGGVYFTCIGDGTVRHVPASGGATTVFAHGQHNPMGIAVDDGHVYWTNNGLGVQSGSVVRLAR